ncbi:MAG: OPT/YSL family transporter [Promethearchaeota archaeon]
MQNSEMMEQFESKNHNLTWVLLISIPIGLFFNFINLYLSITMGFVSIGIGAIFALLLGKIILNQKGLDNKSNLTLVLVSFGASIAAEASTALLFLIWFAQNHDASIGFDVPSWLLPSQEIINSRDILNPAWLTPLMVHWFLMLIPGIMGILFALKIRNNFIHDDDEFPFPSQIQQAETINVMTEKAEKLPIFLKAGLIGFLFSAITTFAGFSYLDVSQPENGWIFGISLGIVGISLFSAGFLIDRPIISLSAAIGSILFYGPIFGPIFLADISEKTDFYSFFVNGFQDIYLSFVIGFILGAILIGGIVHKVGKSILKRFGINFKQNNSNNKEQNPSESSVNNEESQQNLTEEKVSLKKQITATLRTRKAWNFIFLYSVLFFLCVGFVYYLKLLGDNFILTFIIVFWIMGLGTIFLIYLAVSTSAKSSTIFSPPFIFDLLPTYLGTSGKTYVPYLAMPVAEIREGIQIVNYSKLALMTNTDNKAMFVSFIVGYLSAVITTPFFALLLWFSLGIGTPDFPAPAFPFNAAIITAFAARNIEAVLNFVEMIIGGFLGSLIGPNIGIGLLFGFFFPPHMGISLSIGGIVRIFTNKRFGKEKVKDVGITIVTGLSVGASIVLIPLVLIAFL